MISFKHPLARQAKVWSTGGLKGKTQRVLVITTTLELDKTNKKFKADKVAALSKAATTWVGENPTEAVDFLLVGRPKDWDKSSDSEN